jgi:hypothetical protein
MIGRDATARGGFSADMANTEKAAGCAFLRLIASHSRDSPVRPAITHSAELHLWQLSMTLADIDRMAIA